MLQVADDCPDVVQGEAVTKRCSLVVEAAVRRSCGKCAAFALQRRRGSSSRERVAARSRRAAAARRCSGRGSSELGHGVRARAAAALLPQPLAERAGRAAELPRDPAPAAAGQHGRRRLRKLDGEREVSACTRGEAAWKTQRAEEK